MKNYRPLIFAGVCIVIAFVLSFSITRAAKLHALRAGNQRGGIIEVNATADQNGQTGENKDADAAKDGADIPAEEKQNGLPKPQTVNMPNDFRWSLVVLNVYYRMNETYTPTLAAAAPGSGIRLDERVAAAFTAMAAAAAEDGELLTPVGGYVSPEKQKEAFDREVEAQLANGLSRGEAEWAAASTVLPPRCSENNYGLAVDIGWTGADFAESSAYAWLRAHAAQYGFIERYTKEGETVTHVSAAPWHWRYVGADAAAYLRDYNVPLENYMAQVVE